VLTRFVIQLCCFNYLLRFPLIFVDRLIIVFVVAFFFFSTFDFKILHGICRLVRGYSSNLLSMLFGCLLRSQSELNIIAILGKVVGEIAVVVFNTFFPIISWILLAVD